MKKEKMNDKGFSLVELIIVIAIMAVLVVVLAPQYLKYVERSRNSTDLQNATAIVTACQVWAADPVATDQFEAGEFQIEVKDTGASIKSPAATDAKNRKAVEAAMGSAAIELSNVKCKSKTAWTSYVIVGTVNAEGNISFTYTNEGGTSGAFQNAMNGN